MVDSSWCVLIFLLSSVFFLLFFFLVSLSFSFLLFGSVFKIKRFLLVVTTLIVLNTVLLCMDFKVSLHTMQRTRKNKQGTHIRAPNFSFLLSSISFHVKGQPKTYSFVLQLLNGCLTLLFTIGMLLFLLLLLFFSVFDCLFSSSSFSFLLFSPNQTKPNQTKTESLLRLYAYGLVGFIQDPLNLFDVCVVILGWIELFLLRSSAVTGMKLIIHESDALLSFLFLSHRFLCFSSVVCVCVYVVWQLYVCYVLFVYYACYGFYACGVLALSSSLVHPTFLILCSFPFFRPTLDFLMRALTKAIPLVVYNLLLVAMTWYNFHNSTTQEIIFVDILTCVLSLVLCLCLRTRYVYTILGMQLFGGKLTVSTYTTHNAHHTFFLSLSPLFPIPC